MALEVASKPLAAARVLQGDESLTPVNPCPPGETGSCKRWNDRYEALVAKLVPVDIIDVPQEHQSAVEIHSSAQFAINSFSDDQNHAFLKACKDSGVELKWFGADIPAAYTSRYDSWQYFPTTPLPQTDKVLARLYDVRIPLTFSVEHCATIGEIVAAKALVMAATQ